MKNKERIPDIILSKRHKNSNEYLIIKSLEKDEHKEMDRPFSNNDIQRFVIQDNMNKRLYNTKKEGRNSVIFKENIQSQGSVYDFTNYSTLNNFVDNNNINIFLNQTNELKSPLSTNQSILS
jgi:hypothetical protein